MCVQLSRNLKVKCVHAGNFFPENITKEEWYNVVGVNSWQYTKTDNDGNKKTETVIKFLVINDKMKLQSLASYNCEVLDISEQIPTNETQKN